MFDQIVLFLKYTHPIIIGYYFFKRYFRRWYWIPLGYIFIYDIHVFLLFYIFKSKAIDSLNEKLIIDLIALDFVYFLPFFLLANILGIIILFIIIVKELYRRFP